jgi:hypothetical protein
MKQTRPETKIIAISGGGAWQNGGFLLETAKSLGADYAFNKPVVINTLVALCKDLSSAG